MNGTDTRQSWGMPSQSAPMQPLAKHESTGPENMDDDDFERSNMLDELVGVGGTSASGKRGSATGMDLARR